MHINYHINISSWKIQRAVLIGQLHVYLTRYGIWIEQNNSLNAPYLPSIPPPPPRCQHSVNDKAPSWCVNIPYIIYWPDLANTQRTLLCVLMNFLKSFKSVRRFISSEPLRFATCTKGITWNMVNNTIRTGFIDIIPWVNKWLFKKNCVRQEGPQFQSKSEIYLDIHSLWDYKLGLFSWYLISSFGTFLLQNISRVRCKKQRHPETFAIFHFLSTLYGCVIFNIYIKNSMIHMGVTLCLAFCYSQFNRANLRTVNGPQLCSVCEQ